MLRGWKHAVDDFGAPDGAVFKFTPYAFPRPQTNCALGEDQLTMDNRIAPGWSVDAHRLWLASNRQDAISAVLSGINASGDIKPLPLVLQLAYYLYILGDYRAAASCLERVRPHYPDNVELLTNLGVVYGRSGDNARAVECMRTLLTVDPHNAVAHDALASALSKLGDYDEARRAGTRALILKDRASRTGKSVIRLPAHGPGRWLAANPKPNVISFSLWGADPRYLRGAIDNALQAHAIYPDWRLRYHVDTTVPADVRDTLGKLGAEVVMEAGNQPVRERLAWRFKVANDPDVGRFLVRDVDSVLSLREASAVRQWMAGDYWFHVMRDWWTHTDLVLAGMWGGVAGVLPDLTVMLQQYTPDTMETPNVDQFFLRDRVWPLICEHTLVHDRCFSPPGARGWDLPDPPDNGHVGQDIFAARRSEQEARLGNWIERLPSLRLTKA